MNQPLLIGLTILVGGHALAVLVTAVMGYNDYSSKTVAVRILLTSASLVGSCAYLARAWSADDSLHMAAIASGVFALLTYPAGQYALVLWGRRWAAIRAWQGYTPGPGWPQEDALDWGSRHLSEEHRRSLGE